MTSESPDVQSFSRNEGWQQRAAKVVHVMGNRWKCSDKFFDLSATSQTPEVKNIAWSAFPKRLRGEDESYETADDRDNQDEYCEWSVERDASSKIVRVVFTCEMKIFWDEVKNQQQTLYDTEKKRIFPGQTIPESSEIYMKNKINTLASAVDLAARVASLPVGLDLSDGSGLLEKTDSDLEGEGRKAVGKRSLARASDPLIAMEIYSLVQDGYRVALKSPIGMHLRLEQKGFEFKNKAGIKFDSSWIRYEHLADGGHTRLIIQAPAGSPMGIEDLFDKKKKDYVRYGSQFADHLTVTLPVLYTKSVNVGGGSSSSATDPEKGLVWVHIKGRDGPPHQETDSSQFTDYLGKYLFANGSSSILTAERLIGKLDKGTWAVFVAYDALGVPHTVNHGVDPRVLFVCVPDSESAKQSGGDIDDIKRDAFETQTMLIVCHPDLNSEKKYLQAACFDPEKQWFNFYHRITRDEHPRWEYHGCSKDAFEPDTRYLGPFCGHTNGAVIMKELKEPWNHWMTSGVGIFKSSLSPNNVLWQQTNLLGPNLGNVRNARHLEPIITDGVEKWYIKRWSLDQVNNVINKVDHWISHVLLTTTVNVGSSSTPLGEVGRGIEFGIPASFFYNKDAFDILFGNNLKVPSIRKVKAEHYNLHKSDMGLSLLYVKNGQDSVAAPHEGQFPWTILVPGLEDTKGIERIQDNELLPIRELTALLMVDFCNPIYSWRRAALLRYVPSQARRPDEKSPWNLGPFLTKAIKEGIQEAEKKGRNMAASPESEYFENLENIDGQGASGFVNTTLTSYLSAVNRRISDANGKPIKEYLRLAESHRRTFRPFDAMNRTTNPLAERRIALPAAKRVDIDEKPKRMRKDGTVEGGVSSQPERRDWHQRYIQPPYMMTGCPFSDRSV